MNDSTSETNPPVMDTSGPVELNVAGRGISRRQAMQWVLAAVAASALPVDLVAQPGPEATPAAGDAQPYGTDAKLTPNYAPGSFWPLTLTDAQKKASDTLADVILPEDQYGPAASTLGVTAMIDEWVSAPYDHQKGDRPTVVEGLTWIDAESTKRFGKVFAETTAEQQHAICDDICFSQTAKAEFKKGAKFFSKFRSLAAGAYYATPPGWKAIGYVGNVPLPKFDGPPAEVLAQLGVEQTVK